MTGRLTARLAVAALAFAGFGIAGAWSVRLAIADYWFQKETASATAKAVAITPGQEEYLVRLALLAGDEDPPRALAALERAVALNPSDGSAWVDLGLRREEAGDFLGAEQSLLRAAREDKTYLPRWTLTNYYFRRSNWVRFWYWAKAAAPMIYGDPLPLFHLCGRVQEDGMLIERLDIRQPALQAAYLFHLLDSGHAELAGAASRRLMAGNQTTDMPLLLEACDRLIEKQRIDDAEAIWDGLARAGRLPVQLRAGTDSLLTNGNFVISPPGHGLDWRLPELVGISASREENPAGLRLTFSGMQPEDAEPLVQFVPVEEKRRYELQFAYRTAGIRADSGVAWTAEELDGTRIAESADLSSGEQADNCMTFLTPAGCRMIRLSLRYRRHPGTTRIAGYLVLRQVALRPKL
jgi:hypothetical protein